MIQGLPREMNKEIMNKSDQFMKSVQKSAKIRAPRRTGQLAKSITVRKVGNNQIRLIVESPYGIYQERGFAPHWVHALMPTKSGGTIGQAMNIAGFAYVVKFTPFVKPALEMGLSNLPTMLKNGTNNAIQKARR